MKPRSLPLPKVARWAAASLIAAAAAVAVLYLLLWAGPDVLARHDVGNITGSLRSLRLQQARDAARGRLLTLGAGIFAAGALIYTARNFALARQGQVTDRYTKAIDQLGSGKLDVRIGGVYALERVARDSPRDHPVIMDVLSAFIKEHSNEQWILPKSNEGQPDIIATRPDIQAAITVIVRRDVTRDLHEIDLSGSTFPRADLTGANFHGVKLDRVYFEYADLTNADLSGMSLAQNSFENATLRGTNLSRVQGVDVRFDGADLTGAHLNNVNIQAMSLRTYNLSKTDLAGAQLQYANLAGADLTDVADLTGADFTHAHLDDARWPDRFPFPEGWLRDTRTHRLKRADADPGGGVSLPAV